jgi:holo-[acyl-carrier protein] synthase
VIVGIGIDIVDLDELQRSVVGRPSMRSRVFTAAERRYCEQRAHPLEHFAARFAAKEAMFKAVGTGWANGVRWHDAEVGGTAGSPPSLVVRGVLRRRARDLGATSFHLSLTHSGAYAAAVVVLSR